MTKLIELKKIDSNDGGLDAYCKRTEYVNNALINRGNELKQQGFKILCPKDKKVNFIYIEKDGKHCFVGWTDIPYRWYANINYQNPTMETGSGRTVKEKYDLPTFNNPVCPFSIEEIISFMSPNPKTPITYLEEL